MKITLFDIDGTLIHSGGSGVHGMNLAFQEVYGLENAFDGVPLSGRTDELILQDGLDKFNLAQDERAERFKERYYFHLAEDMQRPRDKRRIMPGFPILLDRLHGRDDVRVGLLTGNWIRSAQIKLEYFDLWKYFDFGAFANDESDRNKLLPHALRRVQEKYGVTAKNHNVYVIGDTPRDIHCARPYGAVAVAVATGEYSIEQLAAEKPDHLFNDFSNVDEVLAIFNLRF